MPLGRLEEQKDLVYVGDGTGVGVRRAEGPCLGGWRYRCVV